jgi:hypothetical protein
MKIKQVPIVINSRLISGMKSTYTRNESVIASALSVSEK